MIQVATACSRLLALKNIHIEKSLTKSVSLKPKKARSDEPASFPAHAGRNSSISRSSAVESSTKHVTFFCRHSRTEEQDTPKHLQPFSRIKVPLQHVVNSYPRRRTPFLMHNFGTEDASLCTGENGVDSASIRTRLDEACAGTGLFLWPSGYHPYAAD